MDIETQLLQSEKNYGSAFRLSVEARKDLGELEEGKIETQIDEALRKYRQTLGSVFGSSRSLNELIGKISEWANGSLTYVAFISDRC